LPRFPDDEVVGFEIDDGAPTGIHDRCQHCSAGSDLLVRAS
jgi:hypothetical protein